MVVVIPNVKLYSKLTPVSRFDIVTYRKWCEEINNDTSTSATSYPTQDDRVSIFSEV